MLPLAVAFFNTPTTTYLFQMDQMKQLLPSRCHNHEQGNLSEHGWIITEIEFQDCKGLLCLSCRST